MPSKTSKKKKASKKKVVKKASKAAKKPVAADTPEASEKPIPMNELLPEQRAQMWVLKNEGLSLRKIAAQVGCHMKSVQREFQKDPAKLASIVRAQAEERAALWMQVENKSLKLLLDALDDAGGVLRTETGRKRKSFTKNQVAKADLIRKLVGPLRMAADSATNRSQLLTGKPTEIIGGGSGLGVDPAHMNEEDVIQLAIEHDLVDKLPAALQEKIKKMGHD